MDRANMGNQILKSPRKKGSKGFGNRYNKGGSLKINPGQRIRMTKRIQGARER